MRLAYLKKEKSEQQLVGEMEKIKEDVAKLKREKEEYNQLSAGERLSGTCTREDAVF